MLTLHPKALNPNPKASILDPNIEDKKPRTQPSTPDLLAVSPQTRTLLTPCYLTSSPPSHKTHTHTQGNMHTQRIRATGARGGCEAKLQPLATEGGR